MPELYRVKRNSRVKLLEGARTPPAGKPLNKGDILVFSHVDGMYSYCVDKDGDVVHPAAWTEVEVLDDENKG